MNKIVTFLGCLSIFSTFAQHYEFEELSAPYTNLSDATELTVGSDAIWDDPIFTFPIGFDFMILDSIVTHVRFSDEMDGGELLLTAHPHLPTNTNNPYIAVYGADLIDEGEEDGVHQSPISYKTEGETGAQILKIEWNNFSTEAVYDDEEIVPVQTGNVQVWLYEGTNVIEVHIGASNFTTAAYDGANGPYIGVGYASELDTDTKDLHYLQGTTDALTMAFGDVDVTPVITVNGVPDNGAVYRFNHIPNSVEEIEDVQFSIYPNPVNNQLFVRVDNALQNYVVTIFDLSGRPVFQVNNSSKIDVSKLTRGIYLIEVKSGQNAKTLKFVKK